MDETLKIVGGKIIKLPFQHRLVKMVISNLAGFIISEAIGNGYEKYMLAHLNNSVKTETPES